MKADVETLASKLGGFVAGLHMVPDALVERAATCLMYNVGISYGMNARATWVGAADMAVEIYGAAGEGGALLLCDGRKTSLAGAAFANAVVFGAMGRADTIGTIHASNAMLSAVLALADVRSIGAEDFFPALIAGYEVAARLDLAFGEDATRKGFRSTALFGGLAAAAACARLLRLDAEQATSAIALAASAAGGTVQPFADGSEEPRYQPGHAASLGLHSAIAAEHGAQGGRRALDGALGLVPAATGRPVRDGEADFDLGAKWLIDEVTFKPFPVCYYAQTSVYAGVALHAKWQGEPVEALEIHLNPRAASYAGLDFTGPFNTFVEVMMSAGFAVVHGLITGRHVTMPDVATFGRDKDMSAILARTRVVPDPGVTLLSAKIVMTLQDGRQVVHDQSMTEADYIFGRPDVMTMVAGTLAGLEEPEIEQRRFDRFVGDVDRDPVSAIYQLFRPAAAGRTQKSPLR
ncbi:MmgE/PrpD family protein [Sphingopyxis terrae]|uniref:MmgE/PrpD family protein n=1 Tax=Sphingopyxis terrae TaxID=33052 RepID=UPI002A182844|nr:MmgE/PrpD family protein [Sphingopyxis terrae]MDX8356405.1 MmgE/PrpD family protein [Sphingopyxis terrae]